jgi:phosphoinositide-3-kinase regulatory subunit 4
MSSQSSFTSQIGTQSYGCLLNLPVKVRSSASAKPGLLKFLDGPSLIIVALVTSNIRNCSLPSSKIRALDVLLSLASHLTDEAKLDRGVPYIVDLLHDDAVVVRCAAFRTLIQIVRVNFGPPRTTLIDLISS